MSALRAKAPKSLGFAKNIIDTAQQRAERGFPRQFLQRREPPQRTGSP